MSFLILAFVESLLISGAPFPQEHQAPSATQQTPVIIDSAELAKFVDPMITAQMAKEQIPGAVFILVQNGRVVYQRGYGFANLADKTPVDPERTIWRIGSISKAFTATAVVQLADRGKYKLSDDVNRYITTVKVPATFRDPVRIPSLWWRYLRCSSNA
jgi:CubicO group peptidase (beta-lactamase class C family)